MLERKIILNKSTIYNLYYKNYIYIYISFEWSLSELRVQKFVKYFLTNFE